MADYRANFSVQNLANYLNQISFGVRSTRSSSVHPRSFSIEMSPQSQDEQNRHLSWFQESTTQRDDGRLQETKTTPLFSLKIANAINSGQTNLDLGHETSIFPQYGMLGMRQATYEGLVETAEVKAADNLIYANINAPWSTFICGSQGSGKSHTLSCLLENSLLQNSNMGLLPHPLSGLVFHYDKFTGVTSHQVCEAAYLSSSAIPVRVLVSPSNRFAMEAAYKNLPGLNGPAPEVIPLYLSERQLNITNMITLMNVDQTSGYSPLYLEVLFRILREMAEESQGRPGINYADFVRRLGAENFSKEQQTFLNLRLRLLESFMVPKVTAGTKQPKRPNPWDFRPGTLTIVDLSDPFVSSNDACALYNICLSLFLGGRNQGGCIVALDEAHKFLNSSAAAMEFTDALTSVIAQQRHIATRVIIATQEPTLSPRLLDLCNVTIVHRFLSPAWFDTLRSHLAGAGLTNENVMRMFDTIVGLKTGQALLYSPTAMLDVSTQCDQGQLGAKAELMPLKAKYIRIQIRARITADGGKSILASDQDKQILLSNSTRGPSSQAPTQSATDESDSSTDLTEPESLSPVHDTLRGRRILLPVSRANLVSNVTSSGGESALQAAPQNRKVGKGTPKPNAEESHQQARLPSHQQREALKKQSKEDEQRQQKMQPEQMANSDHEIPPPLLDDKQIKEELTRLHRRLHKLHLERKGQGTRPPQLVAEERQQAVEKLHQMENLQKKLKREKQGGILQQMSWREREQEKVQQQTALQAQQNGNTNTTAKTKTKASATRNGVVYGQ